MSGKVLWIKFLPDPLGGDLSSFIESIFRLGVGVEVEAAGLLPRVFQSPFHLVVAAVTPSGRFQLLPVYLNSFVMEGGEPEGQM